MYKIWLTTKRHAFKTNEPEGGVKIMLQYFTINKVQYKSSKHLNNIKCKVLSSEQHKEWS